MEITKLPIYYCKRPEENWASEWVRGRRIDRVENSKAPKYEKYIYKCLENDFLNAFICTVLALHRTHHILRTHVCVWEREFPTKCERCFQGKNEQTNKNIKKGIANANVNVSLPDQSQRARKILSKKLQIQ